MRSMALEWFETVAPLRWKDETSATQAATKVKR